MKSILVATDLSSRSDAAVKRAFRLAEHHDARAVIVHIIDDELPDEIAEDLQSKAYQKLQSFCASISTRTAELRVEIADPMTRIHEIADEIDADLIVVGTHRARLLADMFSSTTVERLVRGSLRPVLLVKDPADHDYERPVCGLDLSPASLAAIEAAARIAPKATIVCFHAVHAPFRGMTDGAEASEMAAPFIDHARKELEAWRAKNPLPAQCSEPTIVVGGVAKALAQTRSEARGDLIAVGAHGRSVLSPSYLGGLTEELIRTPPCDLLIVRR